MTVPFGLETGAIVFLALALLVAGFVRGYSGFGFSALIIAASGLVMNPLDMVAVVVVWETVMSLQAWSSVGSSVDWKRVGWLLAGAIIGMPLGLWALTSISGYVLLMSLVLLYGWRMKAEAGSGPTFGAGVVSGLANAPGMGGLPVVAFFAAQPMAPAVFRATLVAYFPILDLYSAPLYWWHGMVTMTTIWASLIGLPFVLLANWLGSRHFLATDPQDFRRFAIILLALLAGLGLIKSVL